MRQFTILIISLICVFVCSCKKEPELEGMDYFNAHNYVFEQGDLLIQKTKAFGYRFWWNGNCVNTSQKWVSDMTEDGGEYPDYHYHWKPYYHDDHDDLYLDVHFIDKTQYTVTFKPNEFKARLYNYDGSGEKLISLPSGPLLFKVNDDVLDRNGDAVLDKYQPDVK